MAFIWNDPFLIEDQLTEEERRIRDAAAAFAKSELLPRVEEAYLEEKDRCRHVQADGPDRPPRRHASGRIWRSNASYVAYGLVAREIERIDSGYRSMMSVQSSLVIYPIFAYGSDEQKKKYLPGLVSGELIGCFGLTEPDAGSDPGGMKTRAEKDRGRLSPARLENVDFQRTGSPMSSSSGQNRKLTTTRSAASFWKRA